jgi:hypothetical protein
MSDCPEAASAAALSPSADARAARLAKFEREQLIVDYLNRGVSVAEIAARVGIGEKRMRAVIREIVARRAPHPPEEFVAIQVSRLNEALLVAFSAMSGMNLKAVDRVIRIVRELDRYHGFVAAERRLPEPKGFEPPAEATAAFGAALTCCARLSSEDLEEVDFTPEVAKVPEAANPVEAPQEAAFADLRRSAPTPSAHDSHPELTSTARRLPSTPRPEEPAEGAARKTFQMAATHPLDRPSTRVARGDAPQDEGALASDSLPERGDRPEISRKTLKRLNSRPRFRALRKAGTARRRRGRRTTRAGAPGPDRTRRRSSPGSTVARKDRRKTLKTWNPRPGAAGLRNARPAKPSAKLSRFRPPRGSAAPG